MTGYVLMFKHNTPSPMWILLQADAIMTWPTIVYFDINKFFDVRIVIDFTSENKYIVWTNDNIYRYLFPMCCIYIYIYIYIFERIGQYTQRLSKHVGENNNSIMFSVELIIIFFE